MSDLLRTLARANRLANHRLHAAVAGLDHAAFHAPRTGFFPSLWATLNHVLIVDWYYVAALYREPDPRRAFATETPFDDLPSLAQAQAVSDDRLIAWCDAADDAAWERILELPRAGGVVQRDPARYIVLHTLTHAIHHRGQAHGMLSGTAVAAPQLDEFVVPSEANLRAGDLAAVGFTERDLFRR
ncbi:MAG: DinB family protein [Myxococcota bacterium]